MKLSRRSNVSLGAATLSIASVLVFLYFNSISYETSTYFESRDVIRQLKQLDAHWETEILKSRMGVTQDYDLLVAPLTEMKRLGASFETMLHLEPGQQSDEWKAHRDVYLAALELKTELVEQFKSHDAVLRNSLAFLPSAADDIQFQLARVEDPVLLQNTATNIYDLLLTSLEFAQSATSDKSAELEVGINRVQVANDLLPAPLSASINILLNHVKLIQREQPFVNDLLGRIAAVPVAQRLDAINQMLDVHQQQAVEEEQQYHLYLIILSAVMALLLLYLVHRLVRSYKVINDVNKALQEANASLERRVEERTRELRSAQTELMDAARQAGMAEIATNVLHNVGNVLNSVNISAELVTRRVRDSKARGLAKAVAMMNEHAADLGNFMTLDDKGRLLPGYLNQLVVTLDLEHQSVAEELERLSKSVDHIKEIVATQQSYAGAADLVESLSITSLLEDALHMNSGSLTRHSVAVVREYGTVPEIMGDKHRILLIMINLISNAKYAMSQTDNAARKITLAVNIVGGTTLRICVKDEGEGISPENLPRLFTHGFTTRKEGHGFGLHSCALAAVEMNGQLTAHSDGPGKGASFTLDIPFKPAAGVQ
ncbi:DAHL domain-containing protein [Pseudomonas sp. DWP3-1-2]|uniref:DAHL domain-containing protein n=1 Tax=Pseudomonas sp. DWP3-1-2 TaxID=2804645 RepID=UPI003CE8F2F7